MSHSKITQIGAVNNINFRHETNNWVLTASVYAKRIIASLVVWAYCAIDKCSKMNVLLQRELTSLLALLLILS